MAFLPSPKNESILGELYVFGKIRIGIGNDVGYSYRALKILREVTIMRKKNFKGRCEKGCWISARMCVIPMMPFSMLMLTSFLTVQTL